MSYEIRAATIADVATILHHRRAMFTDMGHTDLAAMQRMTAQFEPWLTERMERGEYLAWFATTPEGETAAGAGLWLMDWLPHLLGSAPRRGNIVNVYTEPDHRRRGLARRLVEACVSHCRERGLDLVILHASPEGRHLYETMGFTPTNEMRLELS
ncbi:MAG: GCN5-related N-acetyltransferase [Gemmatimonadetes bacterium]|nr:GCN5-related N-acetyltransferase [Gemmatimonadota bacterium]